MKLILNAPAIAKLVELDPKGTVELAKSAASQVAQEIARRTSREAIENHLSSFLRAELLEGSWYHQRISEEYKKMLVGTMQTCANDFINAVNSGAINAAILKRVDEVMAEKKLLISAEMSALADQILKERFAAMFSVAQPAQ
jgi:hypothetical protein